MTRFSRLSHLDLSDSDDDSDAVSVTPRPVSGFRPSAVAASGTSVASSVTNVSSPPLFSSPKSYLSEGPTGGVKAEVALFLCRDASVLCRGQISNTSSRFCGKPISECNISKHGIHKVQLNNGHLYIRAPKANQGVNLEPSIALKDIPENERADLDLLLEKRNPRSVWTLFFHACVSSQSSESGTVKDWEKIEPPQLNDYNAAKASLQTPKGLKIGPFFLDALTDLAQDNEVEIGLEPIRTMNDLKLLRPDPDDVEADKSSTASVHSGEIEFLHTLADEWPMPYVRGT